MQSILDAITEWIKEILIGAINGNLSTMFGDVNEKVGTIAAEVGQTPQGWNAGIFNMIVKSKEVLRIVKRITTPLFHAVLIRPAMP